MSVYNCKHFTDLLDAIQYACGKRTIRFFIPNDDNTDLDEVSFKEAADFWSWQCTVPMTIVASKPWGTRPGEVVIQATSEFT